MSCLQTAYMFIQNDCNVNREFAAVEAKLPGFEITAAIWREDSDANGQLRELLRAIEL